VRPKAGFDTTGTEPSISVNIVFYLRACLQLRFRIIAASYCAASFRFRKNTRLKSVRYKEKTAGKKYYHLHVQLSARTVNARYTDEFFRLVGNHAA
jgi:hypothetical protein